MFLDQFDEFTIAVVDRQTRRAVVRRVFGGSLAALLATVGLGAGDDEADAKSACAKKCNKKKPNKKRRKCRQQCPNFVQQGSATLESQSAPDCATQGTCVDAVEGTVTGTPIAEGTFTGELTGTNFRAGEEPDTFDVDFAGTLTATETATGDTLDVAVDLVLNQNESTGAFNFAGTFEIAGGTGRFAGATGSGAISGGGTREGQSGTVDAFTMEGKIVLS